MELSFKKNGVDITPEIWEEAWLPKGKNRQWKDGRSSKEFARFASTDHFKELISVVLKECGIDEQDFDCEPEAVSSLGKGFKRGGQRNHDLLMIGTKDCVIGIEAKVSEPFDVKLSVAMEHQKEHQNGDETKTRAYVLKEYLAKGENVDNVGYQLFTATRGTIYSAIENKKLKCVILVLVFTGDVLKEIDYEDNVKNNNDELNAFIRSIGGEKICKDNIDCWIKKKNIIISNSYQFE